MNLFPAAEKRVIWRRRQPLADIFLVYEAVNRGLRSTLAHAEVRDIKQAAPRRRVRILHLTHVQEGFFLSNPDWRHHTREATWAQIRQSARSSGTDARDKRTGSVTGLLPVCSAMKCFDCYLFQLLGPILLQEGKKTRKTRGLFLSFLPV